MIVSHAICKAIAFGFNELNLFYIYFLQALFNKLKLIILSRG